MRVLCLVFGVDGRDLVALGDGVETTLGILGPGWDAMYSISSVYPNL